jgi:hypothetical protein
MIINDATSARLEFNPAYFNKLKLVDMGKGSGGKLNLQPGQWTDDSPWIMLVDSLISNDGEWRST